MKGLILCAGKGTRLQPFSYSQPKTLLPVANKPVLFYCLEKLVQAGITDIGIVLNPAQDVIKAKVGDVFQGAQITYIYQQEALGIAHALKQAESFIAGEAFILLLGDNLIEQELTSLKKSLEEAPIHGCLLLAQVDNPQDYGIAEIKDNNIVSLVEKPQQPKSDLAVIGAYAFRETIFQAIKSIPPSARGEYEITDAIAWLINQNYAISYLQTEQFYSDVGTVGRWLEANKWMIQKLGRGGNLIDPSATISNTTILPPVIIGQDCQITDSIIGPYVSIGSDSTINRCHLEQSIVMSGVKLEAISRKIKDSLFGEQSAVNGLLENWESIEYILGDKSLIIHSSTKKSRV